MFRDESRKVERKVRASSQLSYQTEDQLQSSSSRQLSQPRQSNNPFHVSPSPLGQPSTPDLDKGVEFFCDNYITFICDRPTGRAALPSSIAWNFLFTNPGYSTACSAAGYAGLANSTGDSGHMIKARNQYVSSIHNIESKIQGNTDLAMSFESAIILAVFEVVNAGSWSVHVQGATAILMRMAANDQAMLPRTQLYWIFFVLVKCLVAEESSPPGIEIWSQQIQTRMRSDDIPAAPLAYITSRFTDLYASVKSGRLVDSELIIQQATALEIELDSWEQNLPISWYFTDKTPENTSHAFQNTSHTYHNFWVARMLSNYRWTRILVNNLLLFHLSHSHPSRPTALSTISRLSTDICHSVASFLEPCIIEEGQRSPYPVLSGCVFIIFPLAVAGCGIGVGEEMHEWVVGTLEMLGGRLGIVSALRLVGVVRRLRGEWAGFGGVE
ncbi:hypothetical protein GLAREA_11466 [Glarea lozoyensis ATCC 20868]|uniref:Transcription factor domain-containing protein n=1 Tax=Glarea lozoyensis (strain ATCC 20868 / MF5171) TaxID=1116229 RepID=S3CG60_GLAL2|nr:uncharacterized protein GLAREA_11466 [Glarea lozoyensis ATCC 20868]EPE24885.1 hypothetical protein GLAREA_11466 [Glarea lozoyensis ATCC 20868]